MGKAQVTVMDKNSKSKVSFKDVAGCDEAKVRHALVALVVHVFMHGGRGKRNAQALHPLVR